MKHIRQRIDKPNLCGTTDMPYLTVRAAQIRQRDGQTDDLCPACVAALRACMTKPPERWESDPEQTRAHLRAALAVLGDNVETENGLQETETTA